MQTFAFYVEDDRYTVPTLKLEVCHDESDAHSRAQTILSQSPHHCGVEVCLNGERVFGIGSCQDADKS